MSQLLTYSVQHAMSSITTKVAALATLTAATVASVATAKSIHEAEKKKHPRPHDDANVKVRRCDLSCGTDDVRDLEYVFVDRTK